MSNQRILPSSWLDDDGLHHGLLRFSNEDYQAFKLRLLTHLKQIPEPTEDSFVKTINPNVGLVSSQLVKISLKEVWDSTLEEQVLTVPDPFIEITSSHIRIWSDYSGGKDPELELNLVEKTKAFFLKDVFAALDTLDFVDVKYLVNPALWKYKKSSHLRYGNSRSFKDSQELFNLRMNMLEEPYIEDIYFNNTFTYANEIKDEDRDGLFVDGDYHVDYRNGIVFNKALGAGSCTYTYRNFPFVLVWDPVKTYPFNDEEIGDIIYNDLVDEDGKKKKLVLNSYGAKIINEILSIHPLQWGK